MMQMYAKSKSINNYQELIDILINSNKLYINLRSNNWCLYFPKTKKSVEYLNFLYSSDG